MDALEAARREKEQAERKQELDALEAYQLVGWQIDKASVEAVPACMTCMPYLHVLLLRMFNPEHTACCTGCHAVTRCHCVSAD